MEHKKSLIWQQDPNTLFESYFLFFSFTNIFNLVMDYTFSYLQNNHPNAPNFKIKSNCQAFFTSQIEPSPKQPRCNQKQRKKRLKNGRERKKGKADGYEWWWWPRWAPLPNRYLSFSYRGRASCLRIAYAHAKTSIWCLLMHLALDKN